MNTTTMTGWRALADKLTPEQFRHLEAVERVARESLTSDETQARASGQAMIDGQYDEAKYYASRNAEVGIEAPETVEQFRHLLRTIEPAALDNDDAQALIHMLWSFQLDRREVMELIDLLENCMTRLGMRTA